VREALFDNEAAEREIARLRTQIKRNREATSKLVDKIEIRRRMASTRPRRGYLVGPTL
jgi:hypothetical protein